MEPWSIRIGVRVDFERLVGAVLGQREDARYLKVGALLTVGSILCLYSITFLPLLKSGDAVVVPTERGTEPVDDVVSGYQLMSVLGSSALFTVGLLMVLQGVGRPVLGRMFPWHPEVRAAFVYALAMVAAIVATAGAGAIWSFAVNETEVVAGAVAIREDYTSPAGSLATAIGALMGLLCLGLAAVAGALAVHRAGGDRRLLRLCRLAILAAGLSALAFVVLHIGSTVVMNATVEYSSPDMQGALTVDAPYTPADIELQAKLPDAGEAVRRLDTALDVFALTMLLLGLLWLVAVAGVAAMGLGAGTRRALRAASLPMVALAVAAVGIAEGAAVVAYSPNVVEDLTYAMVPVDTRISFDITLSGALLLALAAMAVGLVAAVLYVRTMGPSTLRAAYAPATASAAPGAGAPASSPIPFKAVAASVIVFVAVTGLWWLGSGTMAGGGGQAAGAERVDIESLETFSETVGMTDHLPEGEEAVYSPIYEGIFSSPLEEGDTAIYFIDEVHLTMRWADEPDVTRLVATWENQPDTFALSLVDGDGLVSLGEEASNPPDGEGVMEIDWVGEGSYLAFAVVWGEGGEYELSDAWKGMAVTEGDLHWNDVPLAGVDLIDAGDCINPRRPLKYADSGNDYTLEISIAGHLLLPTGSPPSGGD